MKVPELLDPNKRLPECSILWYLIAVLFLGVSIFICFSEGWQTDGFVPAVYGAGGRITEVSTSGNANRVSITPQVTSIVWAVMIYGAMLARRYVRNFSNIPTLILVMGNIVFMASLIESFLPAQSLCLLKCLRVELVSVNPQGLLMAAVLLSWVGMRALSGVSIILLGIAFLSRTQELNVGLGLYGTFYVLCGFLSLLVQAKLPYMVPEGGWCASFLRDFGIAQQLVQRNIESAMSKIGEQPEALDSKSSETVVRKRLVDLDKSGR